MFDLDGTVYLGDELLPASARLLTALRELDQRVAFVSNNPTRTPLQHVDQLSNLGVKASEHEVSSTVVTTVDWVLDECPGASVFAIAEEPLLDTLREAGVRLSGDPAKIDLGISGFDRSRSTASRRSRGAPRRHSLRCHQPGSLLPYLCEAASPTPRRHRSPGGVHRPPLRRAFGSMAGR